MYKRMRVKAVARNNRIPCGWKYAHGNVWNSWFGYLQARSSKCFIWLDAEPREDFNGIKIIFIGQCMQKLLPRSVRPTQCEQTIVQSCT